MVKLFHYVAKDETQLSSNVIRSFLPTFRADALPSPSEVVAAEVEFHAHTFCALGVKLGFWRKVGHITPVGDVAVWFRDSSDYGNPSVRVSNNWWVWKINQPQKRIGTLRGEYVDSEIGIVISADCIVLRMKTGSYGFVYPAYK